VTLTAAARWVLLLEAPSSDPTTSVGGLPLALRLALDAQGAGAAAIVLARSAESARPALGDARLELPLLDAAPENTRRVRVPASFVVHRTLFRAIAAADADGGPAERDLATSPFPHEAPYGFEPIDVRDAVSRRAAESALFRALRKPEDGWTSRYLNRYLSLSLSRLLVRLPIHPNQISVVILAIGVLGALFAARGEFALGALLFQAQSVLDGCDGEVSRITHRGSLTGEWLDTIGDDLTNYGFFGGAGYGLYQATGSPLYLGAGAITVFSGIVASGLEYRYLAKIGSGDLLKYPLSQKTNAKPKPDERFELSSLAPLFKRDTFVFLTLLSAVVGVLGGMLCVFALAALGVLFAVIRTELRLARGTTRAL
jgi:phosphatidylglycerophosphate synthase